jgi:RNA polymerase sigma-70 factor (ECF subfamily)
VSASTTTPPFVARERWFRKVEAPAAIKPAGPEGDAEARRVSAAVARGDEAAFRELYDRYHGRLFRLALVVGRGDETLAQEVAQAAMLTAAAKLKAVESEAHLWNWLARVARQKVAKARRQESDGLLVSLELLPETAARADDEAVLEWKLDAALGALDEDDRKMVERFYFEGFSQKQMAEELQTTAKAVAGRLERARAKLRALIQRKGNDES